MARPVSSVELALRPLVSLFDVGTGRITGVIGGDETIERIYLTD